MTATFLVRAAITGKKYLKVDHPAVVPSLAELQPDPEFPGSPHTADQEKKG
jgi:hypothetical protein